MEEVGRELSLEGDAASLPKRDAHDCFWGVGLAETGVAGGSADCSAAVGSLSGCGGVATRSGSDFAGGSVTETEVLEEAGEAGTEVSGAVEVAGVVSVSK